MKKKLFVLALFLVLVMGAGSALAQGSTSTAGTTCGDGIIGMLCQVAKILSAIIPVLVTLGIVFFVYGVITYVISDDEEAKSKGRDRIIYGIIGLAVIVGMWGLVNILTDTFSLDNTNTGTLPTTFIPN